jgi:NAD(P)-dependent dehydrogenase (short-subunit alcohol dehydrogenase family)
VAKAAVENLTSWLAVDAARFVTGVVVPVDGGFSAYSGV